MQNLAIASSVFLFCGLLLAGCMTQLSSGPAGYETMVAPPIKDLEPLDKAELWTSFRGQFAEGQQDYATYQDFFEQAGLDLVWQISLGRPYLYGDIGFSGWLGEFEIRNRYATHTFTPAINQAFAFFGGTGQFGLMLGNKLNHDTMLLGTGIQGSVSYETGDYAAFRAQSVQTDFVYNASPSPWSGSLNLAGELTWFRPDTTMRFGLAIGVEDYNLLGTTVNGQPNGGQTESKASIDIFAKLYYVLRVEDSFLALSIADIGFQSWGISVEVGTKLF